MLRLPFNGSGPRLVLDFLYSRGASTLAEMESAPMRYGYMYKSDVRTALDSLEDRGWAVIRDGKYMASDIAKEKLGELTPVVKPQIDVVPSRSVNLMDRPAWQCNLSAVARRPDAQPAREMRYMVSGTAYIKEYS